MSNEKKKQSLIMGALTGSAGVFITKAIGLLYVIPFNTIAGDNTSFYSYAYTIYDYILQICLSGMPFAIAALVAKYATKEDYATVMLVRKVSKTIMTIFGTVCCGILIIFSKGFALQVIPEGVSADYVLKTQIVMIIVAFALLFVPILSYYRGFYQGLKELKTYAFTQVLEQLIRVAFLLGASCICVYVLKMDRVWAAYMGVVSTSISALGTILYFIVYDRNYLKTLKVENKSEVTKKDIVKELLEYAIPYLISSIISNSSGIIIMLSFAKGLTNYGTDPNLIIIYQRIINYNAHKLVSIPQVIASGFSLAIIPHITESITKGNKENASRLITKVLETVNYLAIPLITFMVLFSREIFFVMYGNKNIDIATPLLQKSLFIQLFWIIVTVLSSVIIALKLRKAYIVLNCFGLVFVISTLNIWLSNLGVDGYYVCKVIEYIIFILGALIFINKQYKLNIKQLIGSLFKCAIGLIPMILVVVGISLIKFDVIEAGRIITLIYGGVMFIITFGLYVVISFLFKTPQNLFGSENGKASRLLRKFKKKKSKTVIEYEV